MMTSFYTARGKRILDLVLTATAVVLLSPLFLVIALLVKLGSPGPAIYRQERIGRYGVPFLLVKFRSMVAGAERMGAGTLVEPGDSRVTPVGKVLRRFSLDELPQLLNVLAGDMSLVGPRPGLRYQVDQYDNTQRKRLEIRPGVTGHAQVTGRNAIDWGRRIELDLEYLDGVSLGTDLLLLLRTIPMVLSGKGLIAPAAFWKENSERAGRSGRRSISLPRGAGANGGSRRP